MLISYMTLRKVLGVLALLFPFTLIVAGMFPGVVVMQESMSAYYWTNVSVFFVSMLVTFGVFLLTYNGYDRTDRIITSAAGISMLLVALFPMFKTGETNYLFAFIGPRATGVIHYITAGLTFTGLGVMSFTQFTKGMEYETKNKRKRNKVYRICGIVMFAAIGIMLLISAIPGVQESLFKVKPIFWLESICLWSFGVSWYVKGEGLLRDR